MRQVIFEPKEEEALFRNTTKLNQSYFLPSGESRGPVYPGATIKLPKSFGNDHRNTLVPVEVEQVTG